MKTMDIQCAAAALGKSVKTIRRWVKEGTLRETKRKAGKVYFKAADIEALGGKVEEYMIYQGIRRHANAVRVATEQYKGEITASTGGNVQKFKTEIESQALSMMKNLSGELSQKGIIVESLDAVALKKYCYYVQAAEYMLLEAEKEGFTGMTAQGALTAHHFATLAVQYDKLALGYAKELGLTPRSRTMLSISPVTQVDEMDGLVN